MTPTEERLCDQAEQIFRDRNLWIEMFHKAIGPVCNDEGAAKARELLIDQVAQWQRLGRELEAIKRKHYKA